MSSRTSLHTLLFSLTRVGTALLAPCPRVVTHELTDAGSNECGPRMCVQAFRGYSVEGPLLFDKERKGFARRSGTWQTVCGVSLPEAQDDQSGITRMGSADITGSRVHGAPVKAPIPGRFEMYLIDMMKLSKGGEEI
jgi:hypothetical protein